MKHTHLFVIFCLSCTLTAHADIYKRVDADGHVTYSSEPLKGGKKIELKQLQTTPGAKASQRATPENFPKVDAQTQKGRDATRRIILQDELASEEKLFTTSRELLREIESKPETQTTPDGTNTRPTPQYTERLKTAQAAVVLHEQNIKALKTELSNLK